LGEDPLNSVHDVALHLNKELEVQNHLNKANVKKKKKNEI